MNIYSKNGDKGTTNLVHTKNVSKSDDRVQLVGDMDELNSYLGLVKTMLQDTEAVQTVEKIQSTLLVITDGVADPFNREYKVDDDRTEFLEAEISRLEEMIPYNEKQILPGQCRLSAEIDVARSVARRAERALAAVSVKFGADNGAKKYMNRLADYLYMLARYADVQNEEKPAVKVDKTSEITSTGGKDEVRTMAENQNQSGTVNEAVIQEVLKRMGIQGRITLASAKRLIDKIEQEAERRGKKAVIAVCGPDGNPIAVHVMDGAFLVSFDVATKKAYTSVAVKMSTKELSVLAQPGGTFYGVDKMDGGKIVIFGGGVPLKVGDTIIGGLGISGGTGEEDHSLAEYGLSVLNEVL
ncbi:cob(I)yrinic acid a,c-diamide adenosyltransferase [Blautia sp. MSJ-19]|uniref:cob(I)yrinic acid a,c-diamide adenosyltransferase n=1 Tax=Blautia sp. MSJ-19 TaxID=2841517 RepID=UPI001C0E9AB6|nr:cob(I)yrinic acid a,c-diamide adenosyltransferase [Blautia sp. MSJ-19]MBU5480512.1 cob(I)yrinic acid a,c-diamide adenosyltransferase [Blautia sp. MSJ-19]